jgi:hypothetical protein
VRTVALFVIILATAGIASAGIATIPRGLEDARAARSLLGGETWAEIVRIDNGGDRPAWRSSLYPKKVYALVFELSGILWFYTDTDGTQSLSRTRGTLERDKADPGPLFRGIDPGFASWSLVDDPRGTLGPPHLRPLNGCFVESVGALFRIMAVGGRADSPRLLSYYVDTPIGRLGHTVLLFETQRGLSVVDAESSDRPVSLPAYLGTDPRTLSAFLRGGPVSDARTLAIQERRKLPAAGQLAAMPASVAPAG